MYIIVSLNNNTVKCNNTGVLQNQECILTYAYKNATFRTRY